MTDHPAPAAAHPGTAVVEIDRVGRTVTVRSGDLERARTARALIRDGSVVVGVEQFTLTTTAESRPADRRALLLERASPLQAPPPAPPARPGAPTTPLTDGEHPSEVTVIVCTLGRHPRLPESIEALLAQTHPGVQIVVVDNDPASGATRQALADLGEHPDLRIVAESRRGLSRARNTGLAAASTALVAFTDDDAIADPHWVASLIAPFSDARVHAVTGLVLPAELRTAAQARFENYGGFGKGFEPLTWHLTDDLAAWGRPGPRGPFFPYSAGKLGSGNNMAFRRSALTGIGGFDLNLGAGTASRGGEDLQALAAVLLAGAGVVYTPQALVWHYHRESMPELSSQIRANGVGMAAVLTRYVAARPALLGTFARRIPQARTAALGAGSARVGTVTAHSPGLTPPTNADLIRQEVLGLALGPVSYLRSRVSARVSGTR